MGTSWWDSQHGAGRDFVNMIRGGGDTPPPGYVPPLVSNGRLSFLVDYLGGQRQQAYCKMTPCLYWAGRRYGPPRDQLVPFGHFRTTVTLDGAPLDVPANWTQTLETREAVVRCHHEHDQGLTVDTLVCALLDHDLVIVQQRVAGSSSEPRRVGLRFAYQFTPPGDENRPPRRTCCAAQWQPASQTAAYHYQVDGYRSYDGVILAFADRDVTAAVEGQQVTLATEAEVAADRPVEITYYLLLADSVDGEDYLDRAQRLQSHVREDGVESLLAAHREAWAAYWAESGVRLPDEQLQRVYLTAQYHLRANTTPWSFPVGIFDTHWAGRYFGWDEMFCYQALVSSNHVDLARRCPEFRCATLPKALCRASHYGQPGRYGAHYPWESLEDGGESAPSGFWNDHIFHMSHIAQSAWFQYLYTHDLEYLAQTGYPVIRECARFFLANMVYEAQDGSLFIGKCTDLERLGPSRQNPFMTSCGASYTLAAAADAAELLGLDGDEAPTWRATAAGLQETLPHDGRKYVPYAGCTERSVASLGGLFPYPLFDETNELQRRATLDFVAEGRASGNMYPVGNSVCAWYAGWMAAALAVLGERDEPLQLMAEAAAGAGCFAELFEINEAEVAMHPWFATASGNYVYALNQMLLQSRGDEIRLAPAVPESWREFSFKLAAHGDLVVELAVRNGRLVHLVLDPGAAHPTQRRRVTLPHRLVGDVPTHPAIVASESCGDRLCLDIAFMGRTVLLGPVS